MIAGITVLGLGRLGSPLAASFAEAGIRVTGYDLDTTKVEAINRRRAPVQEPGLQEAIAKTGSFFSPRAVDLKATTDPEKAVMGTQACIFVAPTPSLPDGSFDNQYLLAGIDKLAPVIARLCPGRYIFVIASTVTPGSCESILLPAIRKYSKQFDLVYKPELIALGTVMRDLKYPDVGLIGASDSVVATQVLRLYASLQKCEFKIMSPVEAELAKISLNCAITMKISFANQVGMVASQLGADPHIVLDFVGRDSRIGNKALKPGMPFGGPCFPRDNRMFQHVAEKMSITPHLATATDLINEDLLQHILYSIPHDGDVGILGLSYKAGTTVTEESAGLAIKEELEKDSRLVKVHDPLISPLGLKEALDCRTVVVTTDCVEYHGLQFRPDQFVVDPLGVTKK